MEVLKVTYVICNIRLYQNYIKILRKEQTDLYTCLIKFEFAPACIPPLAGSIAGRLLSASWRIGI